MNSLFEETLLSLKQAVQFCGNRPHISTLHRWIDRGVRGHRLESVYFGGRRFTSKEAIRRFFEVLDKNHKDEPVANVRTAAKRLKAAEQAEADLSADGI